MRGTGAYAPNLTFSCLLSLSKPGKLTRCLKYSTGRPLQQLFSSTINLANTGAFIILHCIYLFALIYLYVLLICRPEDNPWESVFPSTIRILGMEFTSAGLTTDAFTH